jgi:hypothetical protein
MKISVRIRRDGIACESYVDVLSNKMQVPSREDNLHCVKTLCHRVLELFCGATSASVGRPTY